LSKLTERVVKQRLLSHLTANNLLNNYQSAYLKSRSTETTLLYVHDHIIRAMGQQKITGLCLLDLSAAFDTIDHSILIHRLHTWFGLSGPVLDWVQSYLSNRSFTVNLQTSFSSTYPLSFGVPQGSVLGPLLFILYTTPLSTVISRFSTNHQLYADDTQLFISFSAPNFAQNKIILESTIASIHSWMVSNFLSLNPSKTEFLLIGLPQQLTKLSHTSLSLPDNVTVSPVSSARNLGFIFDSNHSLSQHISSLSRSCFLHIRDLKRMRSSIDYFTALTIATSLIHSKIDYCNSLFLNLPSSQTSRLQLILNSAARAVTNTSKYSHITPILKSLHWLKIEERIQYKVLSLVYKTLSLNQPPYLRSLLTLKTSRPTRSSTVITLLRPPTSSRLKLTNRSFFHTSPSLWNSLPNELRSISTTLSTTTNTPTFSSPSTSIFALSPSQFHKKLKTYLFSKSFPP